jgi:hypothetical protein
MIFTFNFIAYLTIFLLLSLVFAQTVYSFKRILSTF